MKTPKLSILIGIFALILTLPAVTFSQPDIDEAIEVIQQSNLLLLADWVAEGGDVNALANNDNTLLMVASKIGDKEVVNYLLGQKADPNSLNKVGSTALMIAAKYGHEHVVTALLAHGADPAIKNNNGSQAAHFALAYGHEELFEQLQRAETFAKSS